MSVNAALRGGSRPRPLGFLVVAFHVALVWLVANGLGLRLSLEPPPPRLQATLEEEIRPAIEPPPLAPGPSRIAHPPAPILTIR